MNSKFKSLNITDEELNSIRNYSGTLHKEINPLLSSDLTSEYSYLLDDRFYFPTFDNESKLNNVLDQILLMYSAMVKTSYQSDISKIRLFRGTTLSNTKQENIGFISTTLSKDAANNFLALDKKSSAIMELKIKSNIPHFIMKNDSEYGNNMESEVILSPFVELEYRKIKEEGKTTFFELKVDKKQKSIENITYEEIENIRLESVNSLKECVRLNKEINWLYEDIDNLNKKIERALSSDKKFIFEDIKKKYDQIDKLSTSLKEQEKVYLNFKNKVQTFIKSECFKIEHIIEKDYKNEQKEIFEQEREKRLKKEYRDNQVQFVHKHIFNQIVKLTDLRETVLNHWLILDKLDLKINKDLISEINNLINKLKNISHLLNEITDLELFEIKQKIMDGNIDSYIKDTYNNALLLIKGTLDFGIKEKIINNEDCDINTKIIDITKEKKGIKKVISFINKKEEKYELDNLNKQKEENLNRTIDLEQIINYILNSNILETEKEKIINILKNNLEYIVPSNINLFIETLSNINNTKLDNFKNEEYIEELSKKVI